MIKNLTSSATSARTIGIFAFAVIAIAAVFLLVEPIPQDPTYHAFSDTRSLFGTANFWNVASNFPFLLVGAAGLYYVYRFSGQVCVSGMETAYVVFFVGIFLTAFGSAYYHLAPGNETLVWDRLPMTIGFAGLVAIIVGEFVSARIARLLLVPLLLVGFASVEYWAWTEARGAGDLRPYALVQFLPMMLIPIVLLSYKPVIGHTRYFWWMIGFYFLAKLFEFFDAEVFDVGHVISGHSIKHVAAAMTPAVFLYALTRRR
ncbi:MAG: ceramidase domain-containing protein [Woeseiaceae bacterium]